VELFKINCEVEEAPPGYFKRIAPVSPNEMGLNERLNKLGVNKMIRWDLALENYVKQLTEEAL